MDRGEFNRIFQNAAAAHERLAEAKDAGRVLDDLDATGLLAALRAWERVADKKVCTMVLNRGTCRAYAEAAGITEDEALERAKAVARFWGMNFHYDAPDDANQSGKTSDDASSAAGGPPPDSTSA